MRCRSRRPIVDVKVSGVIADVRVTQRYRNEGSQPIEARYVFPASTRAAVTALTMRVGDRVVKAQIREKQAARREYEGAKQAGKSASLLEQQRPNVFQMSIANLMPGDTLEVELRYAETIVPTDGLYRFEFPTVVGPRYNGTPGRESHQSGAVDRAADLARRRGTGLDFRDAHRDQRSDTGAGGALAVASLRRRRDR